MQSDEEDEEMLEDDFGLGEEEEGVTLDEFDLADEE